MRPKKICVFIGSRANYGRLLSVCKAIKEHKDLELQIILGSSFYNANIEFNVDSRIQCLINSDDHEGMALTTGILLSKVSHELKRLQPDIVLVHGDRYEVLAVAQAAAYMNIPIAHTEGGEVTGCIDDKVRNAITALADIHFPVTYNAADRLYDYKNLEWNKNLYVVGSTALDSIIDTRKIPCRKNYVLMLYNPETKTKEDVNILLEAMKETPYTYIIVNSNIDAGNKEILKKLHSTKYKFYKDLNPLAYASLIRESSLLLGNSSSFIKEGSFLGTPAVIVGNRQKYREMNNNCIHVEMDKKSIIKAIESQYGKYFEPSNYFGDGTAGKQIANILGGIEL